MFPLSSVLFPFGIMPLHIFEPRYLAMVNEAIEDDGKFGVVLIERGSEVGGGDARFAVGTMARIVRAGFIDDERMAIVTVGAERFDIDEWLDEEPYPAARITVRDEPAPSGELDEGIAEALRSWQRVAGLAAELGADVGTADLKLPDDERQALWTLCSVSPLEQLDRQKLLETDDAAARLQLLTNGLEERAAALQARLAGGLG